MDMKNNVHLFLNRRFHVAKGYPCKSVFKSDVCWQALKTEYLHSLFNCGCHLFNKIRRCILLLYCTMYLIFN